MGGLSLWNSVGQKRRAGAAPSYLEFTSPILWRTVIRSEARSTKWLLKLKRSQLAITP